MKPEFEYQCDMGWEEMKGGDRRRFCENCEKHVHHISHMTKEQAREFLEEHDYQVCVDFFCDEKGNAIFAEQQKKLRLQSDGLKQLLASAAAVIPLAIGAAFIDFDSAPTDETAAVLSSEAPPEPIELAGPTPVVVETTANSEMSDWTPPPPPDDPIEPGTIDEPDEPVVPVVEEEPDPPEPVVEPRPRLRGRVAPTWLRNKKKDG